MTRRHPVFWEKCSGHVFWFLCMWRLWLIHTWEKDNVFSYEEFMTPSYVKFETHLHMGEWWGVYVEIVTHSYIRDG